MPSAIPTNPSLTSTDLANKLSKLTARRRADAEDTSNPAPPTPPLASAPDLSDHVYTKPTRRILSPRDHELFLASSTHELVVSFIFTLSDSVKNTTITTVKSSEHALNPAILALLEVLDDADKLLKKCPSLDTGSRFGNPAFRGYLDGIDGSLKEWHTKIGVTDESAANEAAVYLAHSFGNRERIDYGSGHELNFMLWLLCLRQMGLLDTTLFPALALVVFPQYLKLMRDIQSTYYLEPAGSHGVWGLDDYQFLPFLFGASQLVNHKHIRPLSIHNQIIIEECSKDYLYLDQIQWVNATKTVQGLRWHSPMLDDISAAKSWLKVEGGMKKMFLGEVLAKLPVAQHFLFGSLLPATEEMTKDGQSSAAVDEHGHSHNASSWGDCCGIKVPSAIGARQEANKHGERSELRRIPFD
ncbi:hypothetical protein AMS68_001818 [Peltaster fructicola]|uniref:Serine/threonine-protein phosphatase 2A activator n=1 Tax=Peltaster fructicola TaxID=286661 RepID=A0A6H0XNS0_9PEZI|nr:hypothetical protein AMS68_001818 [Peltaster fructicola]